MLRVIHTVGDFPSLCTHRRAWPHALPLIGFIPHEFIFEVDDRHPWSLWRSLLVSPGVCRVLG